MYRLFGVVSVAAPIVGQRAIVLLNLIRYNRPFLDTVKFRDHAFFGNSGKLLEFYNFVLDPWRTA